jgi:hypothetical protein
VEQINKYNSFLSIGRYIFITILVIGFYLLWDENQSLKSTLLQVTHQLNIENEKNKKLQEIIFQNKQTPKTQSVQKLDKKVDGKINDIAKTKEKITETNAKEIVIILPENEKNYSKVIPNIDYKNIPLEKDTQKEENLKINPEVFIDKDEKKINGGKINIETKF